ncbi:hypothetical protein [Streptomyces sp. NPDC047061]|uniref:hypothetical protein n=1 Tax=Streptomyces sp. NPDC047061 TaxID=3154605 RepID=UPI0033DDB6E0
MDAQVHHLVLAPPEDARHRDRLGHLALVAVGDGRLDDQHTGLRLPQAAGDDRVAPAHADAFRHAFDERAGIRLHRRLGMATHPFQTLHGSSAGEQRSGK